MPTQQSTNCYAYASNDPDGHPIGKPQPGQRCGSPATSSDCAEITRASICDGMAPAPNPPPEKMGYYPVALVSAPNAPQDYHWYRLDNTGMWSHKPGWGDAVNVDASGKSITNPENADRDYSSSGGPNYSDFCGYFYVPKDGIRTGPAPKP